MFSSHRKGGRPPLPQRMKRRKHIKVSLTQDEYDRVANKAWIGGKRVSVMLRELALKGRVIVVPEVNKMVVAELGKIGGLIKLIVLQGQAGQKNVSPQQIEWLNRMVRLIREVREMVK